MRFTSLLSIINKSTALPNTCSFNRATSRWKDSFRKKTKSNGVYFMVESLFIAELISYSSSQFGMITTHFFPIHFLDQRWNWCVPLHINTYECLWIVNLYRRIGEKNKSFWDSWSQCYWTSCTRIIYLMTLLTAKPKMPLENMTNSLLWSENGNSDGFAISQGPLAY